MMITETKHTATELRDLASAWFDRTFNMLKLELVERSVDELHEYIQHPSVAKRATEWLDTRKAVENEELLQEYKKAEGSDFDGDYADSEDYADWLQQTSSEFQEFCDEEQGNNYPLWNTLFEFRNGEPPASCIEAAKEVGLGVISGIDVVNTTLFATSGGHSFYSAYWIPLYLKIHPEIAKDFADVDYGGM